MGGDAHVRSGVLAIVVRAYLAGIVFGQHRAADHDRAVGAVAAKQFDRALHVGHGRRHQCGKTAQFCAAAFDLFGDGLAADVLAKVDDVVAVVGEHRVVAHRELEVVGRPLIGGGNLHGGVLQHRRVRGEGVACRLAVDARGALELEMHKEATRRRVAPKLEDRQRVEVRREIVGARAVQAPLPRLLVKEDRAIGAAVQTGMAHGAWVLLEDDVRKLEQSHRCSSR